MEFLPFLFLWINSFISSRNYNEKKNYCDAAERTTTAALNVWNENGYEIFVYIIMTRWVHWKWRCFFFAVQFALIVCYLHTLFYVCCTVECNPFWYGRASDNIFICMCRVVLRLHGIMDGAKRPQMRCQIFDYLRISYIRIQLPFVCYGM